MPRTDVVNIGTNAQDVKKSVTLMPYSRVIVTVDEETEYEAGNTSGLTLEVYCPWGSQAMANNILTAVRGYQYQPYTATGAIVDPAAEMGDAVNVNSVYGGLYQQDITFGHSFYSDFAAPEDEQLDHEFTYESPTERRITRQTAWAKAEFRITNNAIEEEVSARQEDSTEFRATLSTHSQEIAARVTQTGGNNSSFGWSLISTAFILYSGNNAVFTCNSNGISVDGNITARTGYIGNGSTGFEIGSTYLRNGMTSYSDTTHDGVFIGTNGIALGKGNFKVDSFGNLYANNGTFNGTIKAEKISGQIVNSQIGDGAVGSSKISDGAVGNSKIGNGAVGGSKISDGAVGGSKISDGAVGGSKISNGAVSKGKTSSGVQTSLDNGDSAAASFNSLVSGSIRATRINCTSLGVYSNFYLDDHGQTTVIWKTIKDGDGNLVRLLGQR